MRQEIKIRFLFSMWTGRRSTSGRTDHHDSIVYEKAKENLSAMEAEGIFIQDEKSCYYIYELTRRGKTQTGIAGCCSVDDYLNGVVKKT